MATTSTSKSTPEEKVKMIVTEPDVTIIAELKPTDTNKTIEAVVYRKWTSKHAQTQQPMKCCCILLDKQLLHLRKAYRISCFSCEQTGLWEQTLDNPTSLIFGRFIHLEEVPADDFPEHYFNFASYNELAARADVRNAVLTVVIPSTLPFGMTWPSTSIYKNMKPWKGQLHQQLPEPQAMLNVDNQRYENPEEEKFRNRFSLATLFDADPQNYEGVRFTSEATIYKINTQKKCYCFKAIINDGTATMSVTCFSDQANTLIRDCNGILAELPNKDPYELPSALKDLEVIPPEPIIQEQPRVTQVFEPDPPSPTLPPQTTTDAPISEDQPEATQPPRPLSPALSTTASNQPEVVEPKIAETKELQSTPPVTPETMKPVKRD
ncbi:hypothetical protein Tco_0714168 [Tanacetum coccineum]